MRSYLLLLSSLLFFILPDICNGQKIIKKIKNTANQTAEQKAEQKTSDGVNQGIDKGLGAIKSILKKKSKKAGADNSESDTLNTDVSDSETVNNIDGVSVEQGTSKEGFGIYTNFTFEPGNRILYFEDFGNDALGDFPVSWETSGTGEVVENTITEGKWLSLSGKAGYLPSINSLPEHYTLEFDLLTHGFSDNQNSSSLTIAFLSKKSFRAGGNAQVALSLHKSATISVRNIGGQNAPKINSKLSEKVPLDQVVHLSISVNSNRLRVWFDEKKIVDVPSLLTGDMGRYILLETYGVDPVKGHTVLLSNFRIAAADEDLRSKLLDSGRYSTTGIYFNTNESIIKPESYRVLKEVAEYLKENPDVNIQVIGHTDDQGEANFNQKLSEGRAMAVVRSLSYQFGVDETRLRSTGKGESEPVDDNTTISGRANNRRVEFVRL